MSTIVGIDLGTTNTCVAIYENDRPAIIVNPEGGRTTPSVVCFRGDGSILVGGPAHRQAVMNPKNTITSVKRLVGRRYDSEEVLILREITPYDIRSAPNGDAWVEVEGRALSPPEVQSHILEKVRQSASDYIGAPVTEAVVTVPAYFDEAQRQATRDAATVAGVDVVRILNEPTAAALAYGHNRSQGKTLAVIDLGGGTFDVTIMQVEDGVFEVLATTGDMLLGGEDYDRVIARHIAGEIRKEHGIDVFDDAVSAQRLLGEAEAAKKQLTELDKATIGLPFLAMSPSGQPINVDRVLARAEFDALTRSLTGRMVEPCRRALADARLSNDKVDDVLLVGGMTRCASVRQCVGEVFGLRPSLRINPDEAVALGAALESAILQGKLSGVVLIDVAPHTIGLRAAGNKMAPLVMRSTPLPTRVTRVFSTTRDNQDFVEVEVMQGDDAVASNNRRLSRIRLEGLPRGPKGAVRVAVTFEVDASGLLSVSAREKSTGKQTKVSVVAETGLRRSEVKRLADERSAHR